MIWQSFESRRAAKLKETWNAEWVNSSKAPVRVNFSHPSSRPQSYSSVCGLCPPKPENSQLKKLIEQENEVVYLPKVLQCKMCLWSMHKWFCVTFMINVYTSNAHNFFNMGLCYRCSETKKSPMYIKQHKKAPQFSTKKDSLSVLPNEFLFFVERHTGGAPMDCEHCSRAEGVYYQ